MSKSISFFDDSNKIIEDILKLLKASKLKLDVIYGTHQKVSDVKRGLVFKNGIYQILKPHRIIFDGYEVQFLSTFNQFFEAIYTSHNNILNEFAIRTISEMGLKDSQILYSPDLTVEEKDKFKTIAMLTDYGFLALNGPNWFKEFKLLFLDQQDSLSIKQKNIYENILSSVTSRDNIEHKILIKRARKLLDSTRDMLYKKTKSSPLIRQENVDAFFSAFSHLIHGNIIFLTDLLSSNRAKNRTKLRITWTLLMTGINTLTHVSSFLERSGSKIEVGDLLVRFDRVSKDLSLNWKKIEGIE